MQSGRYWLIMDDLVRCPACRGRKQVEKLGGMLGECNTCKGVGQIKSCDKPLPSVVLNADNLHVDVIDAVSRIVPNPIDPLESQSVEEVAAVEDIVKRTAKNGTRAVFKRKAG